MHEDLIKNLRDWAVLATADGQTPLKDILSEAADALEALQARNEELRVENIYLGETVELMKDGIARIQLHQTKRDK